MKIKLFYSYSHKEAQYRNEIEKTLSQLRRTYNLLEWHDRDIIEGQSISKTIKKELDSSDIYLFLFSRNFICSDACIAEWEYVKNISQERYINRIPIILSECAWQDFLQDDDVKALPDDGKPIKNFNGEENAYQQIYEGLKRVIESMMNLHNPKQDFLQELEHTEFISQTELSLKDTFVFPTLFFSESDNVDTDIQGKKITSCDELLKPKYVIVKGEERSGKTALCKYLTTHLIDNKESVIYINLSEIENKKPTEKIFEEYFEKQFTGDYELWKKKDKFTIVFDELINSKNRKAHVLKAKELFDCVFVSILSDQYTSFFHDDLELSDFTLAEIEELSRTKMEELIKKRLAIIEPNKVNHKTIDDAEEKVNLVLSNGFVERYPFHILSILQTFEGYMPSNLEITSYGHCYKALITAHLIKSGISTTDSEITPCFNFLENLAFEIFSEKDYSYDAFKEKYHQKYVINNTLINKLISVTNNLKPLIKDGNFSDKYTYYFFLGAYLAKNFKKHQELIEELTSKNYIKDNNRILLFILHHTTSRDLIEDVLLHSLCVLDNLPEAQLDVDETCGIFDKILQKLPKDIQSTKSVDKERRIERHKIDKRESTEGIKSEEDRYDGSVEPINDIYKILKNNELLGQVLRNHHGNLERNKLKEIIEIVIGSGLRLVSIFLDKEGIEYSAEYIKSRKKVYEIERIRDFCRDLCFVVTVVNIMRIVHCISVDEIQPMIKEIDMSCSPAYELIEYFTMLDTCESYSEKEKKHLQNLFSRHTDNVFIQRVISLRTQHYFNTHNVAHDIKQSVRHTLGIRHQG